MQKKIHASAVVLQVQNLTARGSVGNEMVIMDGHSSSHAVQGYTGRSLSEVGAKRSVDLSRIVLENHVRYLMSSNLNLRVDAPGSLS